jgi:hypothetical protein
MSKIGSFAAICCSLIFGIGCNGDIEKSSNQVDDTVEVIQSKDGTISLALKDAFLFNDENHPDRNTAEWSFTVNSEGRYEVWLSSLTQDTMHLEYNLPVIVTFGDKRLEEQPVGDNIILDSGVDRPYYRADSRLGSIYIDDPGHYNIQVISEKVLPGSKLRESLLVGTHTILDQISLRPLRDI